MRNVFGLGETLLDVIFKDDRPIGANPGGSVLNALVSLSRLKCNTSLISEIGQDQVGEIITNFLVKNHIDTSHLYCHNDGSTTIAMAFLDKKNDATYQFYKNSPQNRFKMSLPSFDSRDIFLFGSSLAINVEARKQIWSIIEEAKKSECLILYDPNCRNNHTNNQPVLNLLKENFNAATIVRCSDEDLQNIFGDISIDAAITLAQMWCKNIIVTQNSNNIISCFGQNRHEFTIEPIKVVNTIGAGDNFNAGIIYSLIIQEIFKDDISALPFSQIEELMKNGIKLSKEVCLSTENYIAEPNQ